MDNVTVQTTRVVDVNTVMCYCTGDCNVNVCSIRTRISICHNIINDYINSVINGGGMYVFLDTYSSVNMAMNNCAFYDNTGDITSAMFVQSINDNLFLIRKQVVFMTNIKVDGSQTRNKLLYSQLQSAIAIQNVPLAIITSLSVTNCFGTGLLVFTSTVIFQKENNFLNNTGFNGGGMAMYGTSRIFLDTGVIHFIANHALNNGGGLFIRQPATSPTQNDCFFQLDNEKAPETAKIIMSKNTAQVAGSALYGGQNTCISTHQFTSVFNYTVDQPGQSVVSSDPLNVCLCTEMNEVNCNMSKHFTSTIPGRQYSIPVCTVGNMDGLTPGIIAVNISNTNNITLENTAAECKTLSYTLTTMDAKKTDITVNLSLHSSELFVPQSINIVATIEIQQCPPGFDLMSSGICECSNQLQSISGITCDILSETISRETDVWIGYSNNCTLASKTCPLDFCKQEAVTFNMDDSDKQCAMNRSGVLCGGCAEGLSLLLGSNKCGECSNAYLTLLLPFGLAGIALVAILIALNLTVSVGAINGLIFYANIVKIQESFFFPNGPVPVFSQFISWINLDLGIKDESIDSTHRYCQVEGNQYCNQSNSSSKG